MPEDAPVTTAYWPYAARTFFIAFPSTRWVVIRVLENANLMAPSVITLAW